MPDAIRYIDSHTAGEPTRVIVEGGPSLGDGPLTERLAVFRERYDEFRRTTILEPRGYDAVVGALLCEPHDDTCDAGVIFFNNTGYLNMCGHGAIGLAVTLAHLGRVGLGECRIETPVGVVTAHLNTPNRISIENVPSYRHRADIELEIESLGTVLGDIAWGGNWFFLSNMPPCAISLDNRERLLQATKYLRAALESRGITGAEGGAIDHIEFIGPPSSPDADARSFVLCPGGEYDRSPCGTGTSAKLACLAADGKLAPGETWVQESVIGSRFEATYRALGDGRIVPTITGDAYVCAEGSIIQHPDDPFRSGITSEVVR